MTPFALLKAQAMLNASRELTLSPMFDEVVSRELLQGCALATDVSYVAGLIAAGVAPITSAGTSAANMLTDANALLAAVNLGSFSRPCFVYHAAHIKKMIAATSGGLRVFPDLEMPGRGIHCGTIFGIQVLCSDALATGKALLADSVSVNMDGGSVDFAVSDQADLELDTAPTQDPDPDTYTPVDLVSAFQGNLVSARATRWFGYKLSRQTGVSSLTSVAY